MQSTEQESELGTAFVIEGDPPRVAYPDVLDNIFNDEVVATISSQHGLEAFSGSLASTLKHAGGLYFRYSPTKTSFVHDLAPKCRAVSRAAELARQLQVQLDELDFWDRWQIFKRLEETGHPITASFASYTQVNPLLAGNMIIEEIKLVLRSTTRYEDDFFETLKEQPQDGSDIGLLFFVQVMAAFWFSTTGTDMIDRAGTIDSDGHSFLNDCLRPLGPIDPDQVKAALLSAHK